MTEADEGILEPTIPARVGRRRGVSVRVSLGVVLIVSLLLGSWAYRARSIRKGIELIRSHRGMYHYDFEFGASGFSATPKSWAPQWLRALVGDEMLHDVSWVRIEGPEFSDDDLAHLMGCFPKVTTLGIVGTSVTDSGMAHLRGNKNLEGLFLGDGRLTDAGMDNLDPRSMPRLELLDLRGTRVSDSKSDEIDSILKAREAEARLAKQDQPVNSHFVLKGFHGGKRLVSPGAREDYESGLRSQPAP